MLVDWRSDLITPERAIRIVGDVVVRTGFRHAVTGPATNVWTIVLECQDCERSILEMLTSTETEEIDGERRERAYPFTVEAILSAVLRHRVTHHGEVLSGDRPDAGTAG